MFNEKHPPLSDAEATVEAEACLQCGGPVAPAPCVTGCPTRIDIPGFILAIAQGRPVDAARMIFTANVLGGSCARVCPVEVLCQGSCVLAEEGRRPIRIGQLQRYATDRAAEARADVLGPRSRWALGSSVGVIGAGPAGLACAAELARMGYPVTVYEAREQSGGLVTRAIAPYKQQIDPIPEEVENIKALGVKFRFGVAVGRDISVDELRGEHEAIFLGVGMGDDLPAKIPGENLPGVWESLRFIEELKLGDPSKLQIGSRVAVIGGGNTAIDVAREAVMLGAHEVMMLYRRSEAQMPAYAHEIAEAKAEGVTIVTLVAPVELVGWERVHGVKCLRMRLGEPDASGRPRPEPVPGSEFVIDADTVIKAIGQRPRTELFGLFGVKVKNGTVEHGEDFSTSVEGIDAGGDCINGGATVVEAVRDGATAARAIDRYLREEPAPAPAAIPPARVVRDNGMLRHFQGESRLNTVPVLCKGCRVCVTGCPTDTLELDVLNQIVVKDANTCVFCGLCEARCPDFAIWIEKRAESGGTPQPAKCEACS
jgi:glutamate synthase (NADPH/NADH) small chain